MKQVKSKGTISDAIKQEVFWELVEIRDKFCFTYLNEDLERNWWKKVSPNQYKDHQGKVHYVESPHSERVTIR